MDISYQDLVQAFNSENAKDDKALICNKKYLCIPESIWSDEEDEANAKARISRKLSITATNIYDPTDMYKGFLQLSFDSDINMSSLQLLLTNSILNNEDIRISITIINITLIEELRNNGNSREEFRIR